MAQPRKYRRRWIGPPQIRPENEQLYGATALFLGMALLLAMLFTLLFTLLGLRAMLFGTIPGAVLFAVTLMLNRKDGHEIALVLAIAGLLGLSVLAVNRIGWASGFQYYIVLGAFLAFLPLRWSNALKIGFAAVACTLFLALRLRARNQVPAVMVDGEALELLHLINAAMLFVGIGLLARFLRTAARVAEARLKISYRELERAARTDPLTLLPNRRGIAECMEAEAVRGKRSGNPFALVLADIDDFRGLNDRFGHDHGDGVLVTLANLIDEVLREQDVVARWSGEQFMLLLPETDLQGGTTAAERVRQRIAGHTIVLEGETCPMTMTYGVSTWTQQKRIEDTVREAEHALQLGKEAGKDRVVSSGGT